MCIVRKILLLLLMLIAPACGFYYYFRGVQKEGVRVAIFLPAIHPAMDEIEKGIKETLKQEGKSIYCFDTYNANGNKTLLYAQAEEIMQHDYVCVCTIGRLCTQTMYELTKKQHKELPIIFTAIDDPVGMGIVRSLESSGNNMTGSIIQDDFDAQMQALLLVKPDIKNLLFVYDPGHSGDMDKVQNTLKSVVQKYHIDYQSIPVYNSSEIMQKVESSLEDVDVLFIYTDHTVVAGIDALITLCNRHHILLYASDLSSGDKGAGLSFGVEEYEHGRNAAQKVLTLVEEHKNPCNIPISPVCPMKLKINTRVIQKQGVTLSEHKLESLRQHKGIIII